MSDLNPELLARQFARRAAEFEADDLVISYGEVADFAQDYADEQVAAERARCLRIVQSKYFEQGNQAPITDLRRRMQAAIENGETG